jgi:hypothetical protein
MNKQVDANTTSPASAPSAITVEAIDASTDTQTWFSNLGAAVDIFVPGVKVQGVGIMSNTSSAVLSRLVWVGLPRTHSSAQKGVD